jgi:two-component system, chemotaxis family, sensor kinase CheA
VSIAGFDPQILQDFLTESGELLDRLESDLVTLEHSPADPELINQVFRALHTIKGSASFLALTNLVKIAHAAESALNAARNTVVKIDGTMMNLLLAAVDTIKGHMAQLRAEDFDLKAPDARVVEALTEIGLGRTPASTPTAVTTPADNEAASVQASILADSNANQSLQPIELGGARGDLYEFFLTDFGQTLERFKSQVVALEDASQRAEAGAGLAAAAEELAKSIEFFGVSTAMRLAEMLVKIGRGAARLDDASLMQVLPRTRAILALLDDQLAALSKKQHRLESIDELAERIEDALGGHFVSGEGLQARGATVEQVLAIDGVREAASPAATTTADTQANAPVKPPSRPVPSEPADHQAAPAAAGTASKTSVAAAEQTIRVEVGRLESLMNLVGELVLQKNRVSAMGRKLASSGELHSEMVEAVTMATSGLDRVTSDIQNAVMRTRMQPLEKILSKYPRLIRDLAQKTNKKIELVVEGAETELDKSVLEELGDPLVHLLRNAADHGIEMPAERVAKGKPEHGTIRIAAAQAGNHVEVVVQDDGRGLMKEKIAKKAIERGLATPELVGQMSDREIFAFIFAAGFSTAEVVSDLSGRGVGMDVVRTNIEKVKGTIEITSVEGHGCTLTIKIPLTVAIMQAMMVAIGSEQYAVPLDSILEIVKPDAATLTSIRQRPVMRLRDTVLPLVSGARVFGSVEGKPEPFAVVVEDHHTRVGILVSALIGQQEVVIKRLDGLEDRERGPISGATVRDDGGVSLIVDVPGLIRKARGEQN